MIPFKDALEECRFFLDEYAEGKVSQEYDRIHSTDSAIKIDKNGQIARGTNLGDKLPKFI